MKARMANTFFDPNLLGGGEGYSKMAPPTAWGEDQTWAAGVLQIRWQ